MLICGYPEEKISPTPTTFPALSEVVDIQLCCFRKYLYLLYRWFLGLNPPSPLTPQEILV